MNYKWRIFKANLDPVIGSEQRGTRPVLVISNENFNNVMPIVTVLPITSLKKGRRVYPNEALLKKGPFGLPNDSIVLAHQIRTISKLRLNGPVGVIESFNTQETVNKALQIHLDL